MNKPKKQPATTNISSDDLTCQSYNTTEEEEDDEIKKDSLYKIQLRKEKINKFFIENPYQEGQLDLKDNEFEPNDFIKAQNGKTIFLEDYDKKNNNSKKDNTNNVNKLWGSISKEVDENHTMNKKAKHKTLDQIMKRINIFKSRLDTLDRNPVLRKILEKQSSSDSFDENSDDEDKKKENQQNEEFEYYSFKKQCQIKNLKKKQNLKNQKDGRQGDDKDKSEKRKPVFERLANADNDITEKSTIKIDENLKITFPSGQAQYHALSAAKSEKEYKKIAREHWETFKKNYKASLQKQKQHQFVQKFVKENKKYNIYLPDFTQDKQKQINFDDDEKQQKEILGEDEEIFIMIDKIMNGAVYQKWKSLQDKDF